MKIKLLGIALLFTFLSNAQMVVTPNNNATQLAQYLAGPGVVISNAVLSSPANGAGFFNSASAGLGISDGVLLTNGLAASAANNSFFFASTDFLGTGDPDLSAIIAPSGLTTTDVCVLEFDITVTGDSLNFSYVFASEEYNGFVCNGFNDVFAFFISGPNPSGGNYVNQNVALIPGTTTPVSINTVNNGTPHGFDPGCQITNQQYYNSAQLTDVSYDGRTQQLVAQAEVVPCATYHFKLAVGDGSPTTFSDGSYDSGVFLEAGSFSSNAVAVGASSVLGGSYNYLVEGCLEGEFTFDIFTNGSSSDTLVDFILGGSAVNGVDYQFIQEEVVFNGNDTTITISIIPFQDNLSEGTETIVLYLTGQGCNGGISDSVLIEIRDNLAVSVSPSSDSLCNGDSILLVAQGADTYAWGPPNAVSNVMDSFTYAFPNVSSTILLYSALGSCLDTTEVPLSVSNLTVIDGFAIDESCPGNEDGSLSIQVDSAVGPVSYLWSTGETTSSIDSLPAGLYSVVISDASGCAVSTNLMVATPSLFLEMSASDSAICAGTEIQFSVIDSFQNASYAWEPSAALSEDNIKNPTSTPSQSTQYILTATVNGNCNLVDTLDVLVRNIEIEALFTDSVANVGAILDLGVIITDSSNLTGPIQYTWTPTDDLSQSNQAETQLTVTTNVVYNVYAESDGCMDTAQIIISTDINYAIPTAFTPNNDGINDLFQPVNLSGGNIREFKIYNQWGDLIHNNVAAWDGYYQGVLQPMGVYNYYLRFTNIGQEVIESGQFTLIF